MATELNSTSLLNDANLQGYWRMENGAITTDASDNSYTLTNNNTVTNVSGGKFGYAGDFEVTNSENLSIASASCANLKGVASRTISAWVKQESNGSEQAIVATRAESDGYRGFQLMATTANKANWFISDSTGTDLTSDVLLKGTGEWNHIVGVYDQEKDRKSVV